MYMVRITTTFPRALNFGVRPKERPTVLKAENTSKRTSRKLTPGSLNKRRKEERKMTLKLKEMTRKALVMSGKGRVLRKMDADSLAAILDFRKANITPIVLVLTPPPVEPGEAPMNMSKIKRKTEAELR
jgi:hypothetical protein